MGAYRSLVQPSIGAVVCFASSLAGRSVIILMPTGQSQRAGVGGAEQTIGAMVVRARSTRGQ